MRTNQSTGAASAVLISLNRLAWLLPVVCVAVLYAQMRSHWYIDFDDYQYTSNSIVDRGLTWEGVKWAFGESHSSNYHPLTWISHMLDFDLFGNKPGYFALENALLHAANATLVGLLFARLFRSKHAGIAVAIVFAAHPKLVEAVAWISQRKTLLSTLFALLTMVLFLRARDPENQRVSQRWYGAALGCFLLSLLAKGMYVTMPFILLVLELVAEERREGQAPKFSSWQTLWPRARRQTPFLVLALAFSVLTVWAQARGHAVQSLEKLSMSDRFANALVGLMTYLRHFVCPTDLSVFYPLRDWTWLHITSAGALVGGITIALWAPHRRLGLTPLLGWLLFLGMLLPVIGIIQVGSQASADRYMYGPILGLLVASVALSRSLLQRAGAPSIARSLQAGFGIWIIFATVTAHRQISLWCNSYSLTQASIERVGPHPKLLSIQATILDRIGQFDLAKQQCLRVLQEWPGHVPALDALAVAENGLGNTDEAIRLSQMLIDAFPEKPKMRINQAIYYINAGRLDEARASFEVIRKMPDLPLSERHRVARIEKHLTAITAKHAGDE